MKPIRRRLVDQADFVVERFAALGVPLAAPNRLLRMQQTTHYDGKILMDNPEIDFGLEGLRDFQQLSFIFDVMDDFYGDPKFINKLKHVRNDSPLPQEDPANSPGRDAQFELYLAAAAVNAGLGPVSFDEPDILCVVDRQVYGIAAKRIKTFSPFEKHIRKAVSQIEKARLPGIIAIELSLAENPENVPIMDQLQSENHVRDAWIRGEEFFRRHAKEIVRLIGRVDVAGVMVTGFQRRLLGEDFELNGYTKWFDPYINRRRMTRGNRFFQLLHKGFPQMS